LARLLSGFHHACLTFLSYLSDRVQAVSINGWVSSHKKLHYRAPQCSVLGPKLFTLHIQPQSENISWSRCSHDKFADNTHFHWFLAPSDFHSLIDDAEQYVDSVWRWVTGNRLKLNTDKTEALLVGSCRRVSVSQSNHLGVGNRDMSKISTLSMVKHTDHISCSAYLKIRRISLIHHLLTTKATAQLMCSFVLSWLDYCNSLLTVINCDQMYRL